MDLRLELAEEVSWKKLQPVLSTARKAGARLPSPLPSSSPRAQPRGPSGQLPRRAQLPVPDVKLRRFAKPLMNISPGTPTSGLYPHPAERVTLRVTVVVRVKLLLTPVMVNVKVPLEALLAAFRVRVEEAAAAGLGLKLAVTPLGNPLTLRETVPVNPPVRVMFT